MKYSWDDVYGEAPASFDQSVRSALASLPEEAPVPIRRFRLRGSLIAAAMLAIILGGTAFAMNLFGLKSLIVTDPYAVVSATAAPSESDLIALQGIPESAEFKANSEWMDALAEIGTDSAPDWTPKKPFSLYSVTSPALQTALDDIVKRYNLKLHTSVKDFDNEEELYLLLGCESPFFTNCAAISGYVYEDGSFHGDGTSVAGICYEYQFGRYGKGSFSEVTLHVGNPDDYGEWIYTTSEGVDVQLSLGPTRCVLMADLPDSFVAINLLGGTEGNSLFMPYPVTRQGLETFAELFHFSALG